MYKGVIIHYPQLQSDASAVAVGRHSSVGQIQSGVSAAAAQRRQRNGGAGEDAKGSARVSEAIAAVSREPVGGLSVSERFCASPW